MTNVGFIGLHLGAGQHSEAKRKQYRLLCKQACLNAVDALKKGEKAVDVVATTVAMLENSASTNAGYGSCLTEKGTVECDAGIMDGQSLQFGAVGAASGIRNPIVVAQSLLKEQWNGPKDLGRVPPCFLAGPAVREWAEERGIPVCNQNQLISEVAFKMYQTNKKRLDKLRRVKPLPCKTQEMPLEDICNPCALNLLDTVGAVALDLHGKVAAATSSGGLALKSPGRIGQAAVYGCGCWAQIEPEVGESIATSTSGCGEYLIKTCFAKESALSLIRGSRVCVQQNESTAKLLQQFMKDQFLESPFLAQVEEKLAGVVVLKCSKNNSSLAEFLWCHTTHSMCVGYMSTQDPKPTSRMSKLPEGKKAGHTIVVEGTCFKLAT